ncbi:MAG: carbohydrate porin [Ignavibacteria bacterium]|nr:carbohydrate porin [Ignavibacteria bacterium]MBT8381838.1 carbohydrate porin [Ignavibacteria bacterium]NNL19930.1 hypothetical protein [Ignavibacteriaceae bacterium]
MALIYCTILFCLFIIVDSTFCQSIDSLTANKLNTINKEIDSLKNVIDSLNNKVNRINSKHTEADPVDSLLITLETKIDTSLIPEDQRSRRKQLDALLNYISSRPGQLFFNGQANAIIQGNLQKEDKFSTANGSVNLFATTSFENNIILFVDLEAIGGNGPDDFAETISSLNGDAGSTQSRDGFDRIVVNEAWTEFLFLDNIFTVTVGKIDLTNYFDNNAIANDENSQFISGAFINNTAFAVPANSPGLRIRTTILERFYIQFSMSKAENEGNNIFSDIYKIGGFGFKLFSFSDYEAEFHLYGYTHPFANNRYGFGISMSQTIAARFTVFGRFGNNENTLAEWFSIKNSWSFGSQFKENIFSEPSVIGIAFNSTKPFDAQQLNEKLTELYIKQQINNWISISAHFQHIWDTGGINNKYSLLGLRVNFAF